MNPRGGWRALFAPSAFGAILFFLILWLLDFPQPGFDDLFYCGAAFNLAAGGDFSNPLLARQGFPSHYFFVYPPIHSFALAGWLKLFGLNSWAVTAFPILCLMVISIATIAILRRNDAPKYLEWLVPFATAFALATVGLRPEPLGVALVMAGFALTEWSGNLRVRLFFGFLLIFLGAVCAPRGLTFGALLAICAAYKARQLTTTQKKRTTIWACWIGAGIVAALIFLVLIDFRVAEFWHTFQFHATRIADKRLDTLKYFVASHIGILQWPLVLSPLALLFFIFKRPKDSLAVTGLFLLFAFPLAILLSAEGLGTLWWVAFLFLVFSGSAAKHFSRAQRMILSVVVASILIFANRRIALTAFGMMTGNISTAQDGANEKAKTMRPTPEHPLLVDGATARYVFGYRLPQGCLDLEFGAPFPGELPGDQNSSELRPGDIFVAGPVTTWYLTGITYLELDTPRWKALGLDKFTFDQYPRRVYIIPAEDCKGSRPKANGPGIMIPNASIKR